MAAVDRAAASVAVGARARLAAADGPRWIRRRWRPHERQPGLRRGQQPSERRHRRRRDPNRPGNITSGIAGGEVVGRPGAGGIQNRPGNVNGGNINRGNINTGNINRGNINTGNVNGNWSTDIDVDNGWNGYGGWGAAAAGAAVGAAVGYAASVGSVVYALPAGCATSVVNGITYQNCNGVWYEPSFAGSSVSYTVVNAP